MVEYYTGQDASQLTDAQLIVKVAHIKKIRELEADSKLNDVLNKLIR